MTDREKAIVMAYTGVVMLVGEKLNIFYEYCAELMGRPVFTHELGGPVANMIKERSKQDFLDLCSGSDTCVQRWIPVSERLPHGFCSVLVTVSIHDDSDDTPYDYTSCGWVTANGEYWIVDNEINNHVVAWMPLPEPYKAERREE